MNFCTDGSNEEEGPDGRCSLNSPHVTVYTLHEPIDKRMNDE